MQSSKLGDQSIEDEEYKKNHKKMYLSNVVSSLQQELNELDSELNDMRPSSHAAHQ